MRFPTLKPPLHSSNHLHTPPTIQLLLTSQLESSAYGLGQDKRNWLFKGCCVAWQPHTHYLHPLEQEKQQCGSGKTNAEQLTTHLNRTTTWGRLLLLLFSKPSTYTHFTQFSSVPLELCGGGCVAAIKCSWSWAHKSTLLCNWMCVEVLSLEFERKGW